MPSKPSGFLLYRIPTVNIAQESGFASARCFSLRGPGAAICTSGRSQGDFEAARRGRRRSREHGAATSILIRSIVGRKKYC